MSECKGKNCNAIDGFNHSEECIQEHIDAITGKKGMKIFDTFEAVDNMRPCMKLPVIVHALQMHHEFRVQSMEGDYKQGKEGDYLMRGIDGELYICDKSIFERSYRFQEQ